MVMASLVATPLLQGDMVELEATADTGFLYSASPPFRQNLLNGGGVAIGASVHSGEANRGSASLLRFDTSLIPEGAEITKVELLLTPVYSYPASVYSGEERLCVYQLVAENAAWVEGTGESLREPDTDPISVPGANGAYVNMESYTDETQQEGVHWLSGKLFGRMDFEEEALATYPLYERGLTQGNPVIIELPVKLITDWRAKPELAKAGLVLWMESNARQVDESKFAIFESRETGPVPKLMISYRKR